MSAAGFHMVAEQFKALADPVRLQVLHALESGEKSVGHLVVLVQTSQPNVSKHLRVLQHVGFVQKRADGNTNYYSISDPMIFKLCDLVCGGLEKHLKKRMGAL